MSVKASKINRHSHEGKSEWLGRLFAKNSYHCDKSELERKVGTDGAAADLKINEAKAEPLAPYVEGKGYRAFGEKPKR